MLTDIKGDDCGGLRASCDANCAVRTERGKRKAQGSAVVWQRKNNCVFAMSAGEYFGKRRQALIDRRLTFKGDNSIVGRLVWPDRSVNLILRGLQIICHHIMTGGSEDYSSPWQ